MAELALPEDWRNATVLDGSGLPGARLEGDCVRCEPYGGLFLHRT